MKIIIIIFNFFFGDYICSLVFIYSVCDAQCSIERNGQVVRLSTVGLSVIVNLCHFDRSREIDLS